VCQKTLQSRRLVGQFHSDATFNEEAWTRRRFIFKRISKTSKAAKSSWRISTESRGSTAASSSPAANKWQRVSSLCNLLVLTDYFSALTQRLLQPMAVGQPPMMQQPQLTQRFPIYGTELGYAPSNGFQSPSAMDPNANRLFQPTLQVSTFYE
jgi:hypothetical protein